MSTAGRARFEQRISRRRLLRQGTLAGTAALVLGLAGCGAAAGTSSAFAPSSSGVSPQAAASRPATTSVSAKPAASWDEMLAAAKREGKVVVSGPPDNDTRDKLPAAFKARFAIELEYLGGNSTQVAARLQAERAAGQYTVDLMLAGADTAHATMLPNGWLDPLKPALLLPEVADASKWKTGRPWLRDPKEETILQLFNTVQPTLTLNTQMVAPKDVPTADALLDPRWKGKIGAYDPSVNGIGLAIGSALYKSKGTDFLTKLFKTQNVVLTRDYQQISDWLAHGSYPIGLAVPQNYLDTFRNAGITFEAVDLPDAPSSIGGGFGLVCLLNRAPHPNAARVFANWIASKEGVSLYSQTQGQVPVRSDIDPTWIQRELIPKTGVKYLDTYDYDFVVQERAKIRDFFGSITK